MTRHDEALERMRSANPLPGVDHVDADELVLSRSHFEERRLAMTTRTPIPRDLSRTKPVRSWRPAIVAVSAFFLVVALFGIGTVVLRESELPLASEPEPVATTVPSPTTIAEEPVVVASEEPAIEPGVRVLSEVPEYGANLVLGPDGLPLILSTTRTGDEYPGTARLLRCADVACDEFTVEELAYEPGSGWAIISAERARDSMVASPNGDVYITLESIDAMHSVGRYDGGVVEPLPVLSNWPAYQPSPTADDPMPYMPLPATFDAFGNPVFVVLNGAFPATANLLVCSDPLCSSYFEVEFDSATFHDHFPEVSMDAGTAQVVYSTGEPTEPLHSEEIGMTERETQIKIATISDLYGSPEVDIEVIDEDPRVFPDELDPQVRRVSAYVETVYNPDEYAAFLAEEQRIAEEGLEDVGVMSPEPIGANIVVARCLDSSCSSMERTAIATTETGWWHADSFELEVAPDGTILVAIAGSETSHAPGLRLFVFPDGDLGSGVDPIVGHVVPGWPAR